MKVFVAVLSSLILLVAGHGWVNIPNPRGYQGNNQGSASTNGLCGNAGNYNDFAIGYRGSSMNIAWTRGGGHTGTAGPDSVRFAMGDSETANFTAGVVIDNIPTNTNGTQQDFTHSVPLSWKHPLDTGSFAIFDSYLQFRWTAGDGSQWYNCILIQYATSPVTVYNISGETADVSGTATSQGYDLYNLTYVQANNFQLITTNNLTPGTTISVRNGMLPTNNAIVYTHTTSDANEQFPLCTNSTDKSNYLLVQYPAGASGDFTLSFFSYPAKLDYTTGAVSINDTIVPGSLGKYYWTTLSSTHSLSYRAVVVNKGNKKTQYTLNVADDCGFSVNKLTDTEVNPCIDMPIGASRRYVQVTTDTTLEDTPMYQVRVEQGDCSTFSSASGIALSLAMVLFALVTLLL